MRDAGALLLIPLFPLAGATILLLTGKRWKGSSVGWVGSLMVAGAFASSLTTFFSLLSRAPGHRLMVRHLYDWIFAGSFRVDIAFRADALSMVMALTVSGVGLLIHIYSIAYMRDDPRFSQFFAYMNLFVFFMLTLVLASNFLVLYVGWEGVGLCSYLLIGFWFERKSASDAAKKAFITTRIGDSAMLIGIIFIWFHFHSLDFQIVFRGAPGLANGTATVMALLLFAGAVGKSAQLPLQVWLPDAMEGPTPVSALIHAATMVTAGVYLVVRTHPIFEASSVALTVVAVVGIVTAVYAGLSAIGQDDIKRMLAYSTISQLGFMFFGAGVKAYAATMFLLVTHAFFKACLFLCAGSVMHALPEEEPLSGFFAKDQVVAAASESGREGLWILALFGVLLTAIYMGRSTFMAFFGKPRYRGHPHDPPALMGGILGLLAVGAAVNGLLNLSRTGLLERFLVPVTGPVAEVVSGPAELPLAAISLGLSLVGVALAFYVYLSGRFDWQALRSRFVGPKRALEKGLYVNDVYSEAIVIPARAGAAFTAYVVDKRVVDGAVNGIGRLFTWGASVGRRVQTGLVRSYALAILLGAVGVLLYLAVRF